MNLYSFIIIYLMGCLLNYLHLNYIFKPIHKYYRYDDFFLTLILMLIIVPSSWLGTIIIWFTYPMMKLLTGESDFGFRLKPWFIK